MNLCRLQGIRLCALRGAVRYVPAPGDGVQIPARVAVIHRDNTAHVRHVQPRVVLAVAVGGYVVFGVLHRVGLTCGLLNGCVVGEKGFKIKTIFIKT